MTFFICFPYQNVYTMYFSSVQHVPHDLLTSSTSSQYSKKHDASYFDVFILYFFPFTPTHIPLQQ